ncbi:MAG TPA: carboxypeptidase regulatory-like domain-containing protein [Herpetosiphonaceae bacterium]
MYASRAFRWSTLVFMALFLFPLLASASEPAKPMARIDAAVMQQATVEGESTFWVVLKNEANLTQATSIQNWTDRGEFVVDQLKNTADASQQGIRSLLDDRGIKYESFWIVNAIKLTADPATIKELAARPEVEEIRGEQKYELPEPIQGKEENTINAVEWGIDRIRADDVWSSFNVRGEGIVVANIDTGVLHTHPALVNQYRGRNADGTFNHNYNWFDPANACNNGRTVPCDNNGHGTHTMGTMAGNEGANQVGVAPGVKWIAAKGCESNSCSDASLLSSGQWILAPTDLSGANPRADLRPNIVNNSWGGGGGDTWYRATVQAWIAAGIFPAFSNGNSGPACATSGSPGDYAESYSSGAFDINNAIASFSSRGAPVGGGVKPNIAAPGVNVRSAWNNGAYNSISGTSMASPHLAGTVALMWSAAPSLIGDIATTKTILNQTAVDTSDLTCGGTAANNNVWGEGKLDAFAAVDQSPRGPVGTLTGTVTNASTGAALSGITVAANGPSNRTAVTNASGQYSFQLPVGAYSLSVSSFGYQTATANATVTENATTTQNFALQPAASHAVSGTVRDSSGQPVANATVTITGTPIAPTTTNASGAYSFASVPAGEYDVRAEAGGCNTAQTQHLVVDGAETLNFTLPQRSDSFGYFCRIETFNYIEAGTVLPLTGDDASVRVDLPFSFSFYGQDYTAAYVATNGYLNFLAANSTLANVAIPSTGTPNGAIYPFWDDLFVDAETSVRTQLLGTSPSRQFVIEWRNVRPYGDTTRRMDFEVILHENGRILTQYRNLAADGREQGNSATVGIENQTGTVALQYSFNQAALSSGLAVLYRLPANGFAAGRVTDANDGQAIAGATVKAIQNGATVRQATTDANGAYRIQLGVGDYTIEASATNYSTESQAVTITEDQVTTADLVLHTARARVTPAALEVIIPSGQSRTRTLALANTGDRDLTWTLTSSGESWISATPTSGTLAPSASQNLTVSLNAAGLQPGVYNATLTVESNSGRQPTLPVAVKLIVPGYRQGVDAGSTSSYTDANGDAWAADKKFATGSWGYLYKGSEQSTSKAIANTTDDKLYQTVRQGTNEYRFENVPNGVYQIEFRFAEIKDIAGNKRIFDVTVEDQFVLAAYDISGRVGKYTADDRSFFVTVTDGQLNIKVVSRKGYQEAILNSLRVTHRPDR